VATRPVQVDPDIGISDLVRRLTDDSKRLVSDEVRLAKLEAAENLKTGAKGAMWMGLAFGVGVIALVALTITLTAAIGWAVNHHYWLGAVVTGILELALGAWLLKRGLGAFGSASYTLGESREEIQNTRAWIARERAG
jgi:uncharacterized membrane protein YqjE